MTSIDRRSAWTLGAAALAAIATPGLATAADAPKDELRIPGTLFYSPECS